MRIRRVLALLAVVAPFLPLRAAAQATGDQSRLVFSLTGGYAAGKDLWSVGGQSLTLDGLTDILAIDRTLTGTWAAGLGVIYFKGENFGWTLDAHLVNSRIQDSCRLLSNSGSEKNAEVCASINGAARSAMSVALSAGGVFRAASREKVSPFARVQGGVYFGNLNTTMVQGTFVNPDNELVFVNIYPGGSSTTVSPEVIFGAGVTLPVAKAYHLRLEGRSMTYQLDVITGATGSSGTEPNTGSKWITQFSVHAGVDIVLERKRGKRY